jgi:hypothetical protein
MVDGQFLIGLISGAALTALGALLNHFLTVRRERARRQFEEEKERAQIRRESISDARKFFYKKEGRLDRVEPPPEMKWNPPVLVEPEDGAVIGPEDNAILVWKWGQLGEDEYYHLSVCWGGCDSPEDFYDHYLRDTEWIFPERLRGSAPGDRFHWDITVRYRIGNTAAGPSDPPVSPPSETRVFLFPRQ